MKNNKLRDLVTYIEAEITDIKKTDRGLKNILLATGLCEAVNCIWVEIEKSEKVLEERITIE